MGSQWRIQDFPEVAAPTLQGAPAYDFAKFSQKLHLIERIWTGGRVPRAPINPPLVRRESNLTLTLNNDKDKRKNSPSPSLSLSVNEPLPFCSQDRRDESREPDEKRISDGGSLQVLVSLDFRV